MKAFPARHALAAFLLLHGLVASAASSLMGQVGGVPLAIPVPPGFSDPSAQAPQLRDLAERLTPPTSRLLAVFVADRDLKLTREGKDPLLHRYFLVQTPIRNEQAQMTPEQFSQLKQTLRAGMQTGFDSTRRRSQAFLDSATQKLGKEAGVEFSMKMGESKVLSFDDDRPRGLSFSTATKYASDINGVREEIPMVMSTTVLLAKGKVFFAYAYSQYRAPADLDWVRAQARFYMDTALTAN